MLDLAHYWYRSSLHLITILLLPLSWLFGIGTKIRRWLYRRGIKKVHRFAIPVVTVGNITVGGTGKTPFVIWLAHFLKEKGFRPGIVSRGVGGKKQTNPYWVKPDDIAETVGDEAILLAKHSNCPVVIGIDRVAAVRDLLEHTQCNIVISDDGLQHYRLGRDIEIAIVDGERRFGNRLLLPAGPLRESVARLQAVDFTVINGGDEQDAYTMSLEPTEFVSLLDPQNKVSFVEFPRQKIHAVAGIGNPGRFFHVLKQAGFDVVQHPFPDHYLYQTHDVEFTGDDPVMMTEKDAVKCHAYANQRYWYLRITAKINNKLEQQLSHRLTLLGVHHDSEEDFSKRPCRVTDHNQCGSIRE